MKSLAIDFTSHEDAQAKATWSDTNALTITAAGLGRDGAVASFRNGWIQTKPIAVGRSWRPASSATLQVLISPPPTRVTLNSGQTSLPWVGTLFARYSPDCKHWSSWQALRHDETKSATRAFTGQLSIPQRERQQYSALLAEYARLEVAWKSDEEAAVDWIIQRTPDFFKRSIPFIGYIELLYEVPFYGGQRISRFQADVSFGLSGLHDPPKNPDVLRDREETPWRFKAQ